MQKVPAILRNRQAEDEDTSEASDRNKLNTSTQSSKSKICALLLPKKSEDKRSIHNESYDAVSG